MSDDTRKRGRDDRIRINIGQVFERSRWCKAFGITQTRLKEAVKAAGPMVKNVKAWLIKQIEDA